MNTSAENTGNTPEEAPEATLLFLDIDGVMLPFNSFRDHWRDIFYRNMNAIRKQWQPIIDSISSEKREVLNQLVQNIGKSTRVVISSDWRKTIPIEVLEKCIGQDKIDVTPFTQRNILDPSKWKKWTWEATHKKEIRIKQIEQYCNQKKVGKIGRIIVVDDSNIVPEGYQILSISVQSIHVKSHTGLDEIALSSFVNGKNNPK